MSVVVSFSAGVWVVILNLIALFPGSSILTLLFYIFSAPEKPFTGKEVHRVGAFVQQFNKDKSLDTDDIPFLSLLQQNKPELKLKADSARTDTLKAVAGGKNDGSKTDTSDSALSESKTSVSSQASAPDDFVMVELVSYLTIRAQNYMYKMHQLR